MFSIGLDVIGAMDDRQDICIMYNQLGIPTLEAMKDGK
jgi:hypothetical protein